MFADGELTCCWMCAKLFLFWYSIEGIGSMVELIRKLCLHKRKKGLVIVPPGSSNASEPETCEVISSPKQVGIVTHMQHSLHRYCPSVRARSLILLKTADTVVNSPNKFCVSSSHKQRQSGRIGVDSQHIVTSKAVDSLRIVEFVGRLELCCDTKGCTFVTAQCE